MVSHSSHWLKHDQDRRIDEDADAGISKNGLRLRFQRIDRRMAGNYACLVSFDVGESRSNALDIKVQCKSTTASNTYFQYPLFNCLLCAPVNENPSSLHLKDWGTFSKSLTVFGVILPRNSKLTFFDQSEWAGSFHRQLWFLHLSVVESNPDWLS